MKKMCRLRRPLQQQNKLGNQDLHTLRAFFDFRQTDSTRDETEIITLYNLVPRAFSSTIFKMADRREKTLANAELTPSLIGPFIRTR